MNVRTHTRWMRSSPSPSPIPSLSPSPGRCSHFYRGPLGQPDTVRKVRHSIEWHRFLGIPRKRRFLKSAEHIHGESPYPSVTSCEILYDIFMLMGLGMKTEHSSLSPSLLPSLPPSLSPSLPLSLPLSLPPSLSLSPGGRCYQGDQTEREWDVGRRGEWEKRTFPLQTSRGCR